MSGSTLGKIFKITTWGESHGKGVGVVIDGCPSGIRLTAEDIQKMLDRRKPGSSKFTTQRKEDDSVEILSGVFEDITTGTPISLVVFNKDQRSRDYSNIKDVFRPSHADYPFQKKYDIRDYRGGGRSSGRETIGRVASGAIAKKILENLGVDIFAYTKSIGDVEISEKNFERAEIYNNTLAMPDKDAFLNASKLLENAIANCDSVGGVVECKINNLKTGIGEPVFDKLDALIGQGLFSIGAVKAVEIGLGIDASKKLGSQYNDAFYADENSEIKKYTNNSGGILGGMSDGDEIIIKAHFKPTPSIAKEQDSVTSNMENKKIIIEGRHDPIIVPRAVVVVESMVALVVLDLLLQNMVSNFKTIKNSYDNL